MNIASSLLTWWKALVDGFEAMDNSCEGFAVRLCGGCIAIDLLSIGGNSNWRECDAAGHSIVERDNLVFGTVAVYDAISYYHMA